MLSLKFFNQYVIIMKLIDREVIKTFVIGFAVFSSIQGVEYEPKHTSNC